MVYFTSDLHFGHDRIIYYDKRPFESIEQMDKELIKKWNNKVLPEDDVYILGDISWYKNSITVEICNQLNGKKHLILGNHDSRLNQTVLNLFVEVTSYKEIVINNKQLVLCHYPIHYYNNHYHGAIMLYGHVHVSEEEKLVQQYRKELNSQNIPCQMYNVGCMLWNYEPVTLDEILTKKGD